MVFIVQCAIWKSVFKLVKIECRHKMKRDFSQTWFGFLLKYMEVSFKLKRYIFKLHLFGFQFAMHLRFHILWNWRSYVLFGFKFWYRDLLHLPCVVFVVCVVNRIMKWIFLESITRSIAKSKPTLLQYFFSSKNVSNAKPLWPVYNLMPLPFDGDGPLVFKANCSWVALFWTLHQCITNSYNQCHLTFTISWDSFC